MGKVLISDTGKGTSAIGFWWFFNIACGVVFGGFCFLMSINLSRRGYLGGALALIQVSRMSDIWMFSAIFGVAAFFLLGALEHRAIAKTEIKVCENGVAGKGLGKYFLFGDFRTFGFQLKYDQITSVDVTKNTVIIHAANSQYKCYVSKGEKIQNFITQLKGRR